MLMTKCYNSHKRSQSPLDNSLYKLTLLDPVNKVIPMEDICVLLKSLGCMNGRVITGDTIVKRSKKRCYITKVVKSSLFLILQSSFFVGAYAHLF